MPKITYQDRPDYRPIDKPGRYRVKVVAAKEEISTGAKTSGSDTIVLTLATEDGAAITETLIFHENTEWKIEQFIKAINCAPKKGQEIEISAEILLGEELEIEVRAERYKKNGEDKVGHKVARFWPVGAGKAAPAEAVKEVPKAAKLVKNVAPTKEDDLPY